MKRIYRFFALAALMLPLSAWAQITLPFSCGFETTDALSGWTVISNNSSNETELGRATVAAYSGGYGFRFSSVHVADDYNQYLITPAIETGTNKTVKFWYRNSNVNLAETFAVGYSTTNAQVSSFTWLDDVTASSGWEEYSATIPYNATYVAINYKTHYLYRLYIDDFSLTPYEWVWGDEMSYCGNNERITNIGFGGNRPCSWGVVFPQTYMAWRNYLTTVQLYAKNIGEYTLNVYSGTTSTPETRLYTYTKYITDTAQWVAFDIIGGMAINTSRSLWVTFSTQNISHPISISEYCGEVNSSKVYYENEWVNAADIANPKPTFMIKATTSATRPAFDFELHGNDTAVVARNCTYTTYGPTDATYQWTIDGGALFTTASNTLSTTWTTIGPHTIAATGTLGGSTITKSLTINVVDSVVTLPYYDSFEKGLIFWTAFDEDGDGYNWGLTSQQGSTRCHTGTNAANSASYYDYSALTPDNYLVGPAFVVPTGGVTVEWWDYGDEPAEYHEYYSVYVTTGSNPTDTAQVIYSDTIHESRTWVHHSCEITNFVGDTVHVAFRHHNCTDQFWLIIDDVSITPIYTAGIANVNTVQVHLTPNPVSDRLHINGSDIIEATVIDINGRELKTVKNSTEIDMSDLGRGMYFVRIIATDGSVTKKIRQRINNPFTS